MKFCEKSFILFAFFTFVLGIIVQASFAQGLWGLYFSPWSPPWIGSQPYAPFAPLSGSFLFQPDLPSPLYLNPGWGNLLQPLSAPGPILPTPYQRSPSATIIFTSPTLTAITASPGVILIGGTNVLVPQTVVAPTVPPTAVVASLPTPVTIPNPTPAPLFSLLAVLYASGTLDGQALLSTANPLLFAYLTTLLF